MSLKKRTLEEGVVGPTPSEDVKEQEEQKEEGPDIASEVPRVVESNVENLPDAPIGQKIEESKPEKTPMDRGVEIDQSLKRKGLDFTDSLSRVSAKLGVLDKEAGVVSPGTIGKFRTAIRSLGNVFEGSQLDLNEATNSFNRLTASFEDLSLISDRELGKINVDSRKSLVAAIEGSRDAALALRMQDKMGELSRNINRMIDKAGAAASRFRKGPR